MAVGYLIDEKDLLMYVDWCRDMMTNEKAKNWVDPDQKETFEDQRDDLHKELDRFLTEFLGSGRTPPIGEAGLVFHSLMQMASLNHRDEFSWHTWRKDNFDLTWKDDQGESTDRPIGYGGGTLIKSTILHASALIKHTYSSKPDPIDLKISSMVQDDQTIYIGYATASEIDAISSVPWMDPTMDSCDFGNKLYNDMMKEDEWQRVVDIDRVYDIGSFISSPENYILNPVLLYVDRNQPSGCLSEKVKLNGEGVLEINFDFLQERREGLTDYVPKPGEGDSRPLFIVDGQHRIRGMAMSERGHTLNVPFVLIVGENPDEDHALIARIFTEINTKSVQIDTLHKIYLAYKFGMTGSSSSEDFGIDRSEGGYPPKPTLTGRSQRRAYELAQQMASIHGSPLYDMIEFQRPVIKGRRRPYHICVNAANWIHYVRKWFASKKIYADLVTDDFCAEELMNYFKAFEETCSSGDWRDPRWVPGKGRGKPLLQFEGPFLSLLELFPRVVTLITEGEGIDRPISKDAFLDELKPLTNVDWLAASVLTSNLKGRTNNNIKHLVMWMEVAIKNGKVNSTKDILDPALKSKPGKGLLAPPGKSAVNTIAGPSWPGLNPIQLRCVHLEHTLYSDWIVRWIRPSGPEEWNAKAAKAVANLDGESQLSISLDAVPPDATAIEVQALLGNANGTTLTERIPFKK